MKGSGEERVTREILMKSYLDLEDPEFSAVTMKKILRESRRRRIVDNFLVNLLAFIATDAFIWLGLHLTGINIPDIVKRTIVLFNRVFVQAAQLNGTIAVSEPAAWIVLSIGAMAALLAIAESRLGSWKNGGRKSV